MVKKYTIGSFETNTYIIIENDKAMIVDPTMDFFPYYIELKKQYQIQGFLITHAHIDHIKGLEDTIEPIYISNADYEMLKDNSLNLSYFTGIPFQLGNNKIIKLNDKDKIMLETEEIVFYLTSGHTIGSGIFTYKNIIFTGDTLFKNGVGRCDLPTGNYSMLVNSLKRFANFSNTYKIYPGHDESSNLKEEKVNNLELKNSLK